MVAIAQSGFCIPWRHKFHLLQVLLLLLVTLSGAEAIRNPRRRLNQLLLPFYPGSLACGNTFTCGLQSTGQAFCWGNDNSLGQLGTNAATGTIAPAPISGNGTYIKISAGFATACGIQNDLTGWCWGLNDQGQAGALNQSQPINSSLFTPTQIYGNDTWLEIAVGETFACGIKTNRSLFCWGNTYSGALGIGQLNSTVLVPQEIKIGGPNEAEIKWNKVACGWNFACAIATNGSLYCWGDNQYGQTGTGNQKQALTVPTLVPIPLAIYDPQTTWEDIFIGSASLFAFATLSDGTSWSWGDGTQGTLAIEDITVTIIPEQMLTAQSWNLIRGGQAQVLGISDSSQGFAWGTGNEGQLGVGLALNASVGPVKIDIPDPEGGNWSELCANTEQSCAIFKDEAYCWGSSASGLLGSPGGDTSFPRRVEGKGLWGVRPFSPPPAPPEPQPPPPSPKPTAPKPPPPSPPTNTTSGASVGEIVGAVVGGVAGVSVLLLGVMVWRRKRRQKRKALGNGSMNNNGGNAKPDAVLLWAAHSQDMESPRAALTSLIPPSLAPLEFDWSDVEVLKPLGAGSFGAVYLANINHTKMAVKVLVDADAVVAAAAVSRAVGTPGQPGDETRSADVSDKEKEGKCTVDTTSFGAAASSVPKAHIEKMLQEASLMATLQHPNVVHLLGFCISPPCLAVEYCPRGSLYEVLAQASTDSEGAKRLTWIRRLRMAQNVAAGLLHLHSRTPPILHRDVKSPNILVAADLTVKVADMGLSKLAEEVQGGSKVSTLGGGSNPRWLAPEILDGQKASMESDVFSFGVVLWELLTWKLPWSEENVWVVSSAVLRNERPDIPPLNQLPGFDKGISEAQEISVSKYIELMKRCWTQDPLQRPDFAVVAAELGELLREQSAKFSKG
ncbi:hypothetical protein Ndes2526B_g00090 [Nannochloris sp. 'desiccata']